MRVHPATIRPCEKGNYARYVFGLPQTLQRRHLGNLRDQLFALTLKEEFSRDRPWRDGIHSNVAPTEFVRKHVYEPFDAGL